MKKMYCYSEITNKIKSANIEKETEKMYILENDLKYKKRYNKSEIGRWSCYAFVSIAESKQEFLKMIQDSLERRIESYNTEIEKIKEQIKRLNMEE